MKTKTKLAFIIIVILALVTVATVSAQVPNPLDPSVEPVPCPNDSVSGVVVAVDDSTEIKTVWIWTGTELCEVVLPKDGVSSGHPIADLIGNVFQDVTSEDLIKSLSENLETNQVCVEQDSSGDWNFAAACNDETFRVVYEDEGTYTAIKQNADGTFTIMTFMTNEFIGDLGILEGDVTNYEQQLELEEDLDGNGNVLSTSDQVEAYHMDGIGFGVLVKLYSIAEENNVSVQDLVDEFKAGMGWGQIFRQYPKPEKLGVGHVRKAAADMTNGDEVGDNGEGEIPTTTKFQGLGRGQGNNSMTPPGLAKKNQDTSTETTVQEPSSSSSHPGKGKGPAKDNPGKGNGKGKSKGKGKP
jgi:hypothetical protein